MNHFKVPDCPKNHILYVIWEYKKQFKETHNVKVLHQIQLQEPASNSLYARAMLVCRFNEHT